MAWQNNMTVMWSYCFVWQSRRLQHRGVLWSLLTHRIPGGQALQRRHMDLNPQLHHIAYPQNLVHSRFQARLAWSDAAPCHLLRPLLNPQRACTREPAIPKNSGPSGSWKYLGDNRGNRKWTGWWNGGSRGKGYRDGRCSRCNNEMLKLSFLSLYIIVPSCSLSLSLFFVIEFLDRNGFCLSGMNGCNIKTRL